MAQPEINVDDVVRAVLAQLGLAADGQPAAPAAGMAGNAPASSHKPQGDPAWAAHPDPTASDGQLVVRCRVVTMAELGDRLAGIRRLVVPPQALVTPAVRDEMRRRGIALVHAQKAISPASASACGARLTFMVARCSSWDPLPLATALQNEGMDFLLRDSDCLMAAVDQLAVDLKQGKTLGVLATTYATAGLCLANRLSGVRAVLGSDARTVAADTASVGANLLVVDPTVLGLFQLRQLVGRFCHEPKHECPKVFQKRLG